MSKRRLLNFKPIAGAMPRRKGTKMNRAFIAHHRTVAKKTAIAFGVMFVMMVGFTALGFKVLMMDDLFAVATGIGMISIGCVGIPWSILGCLFSLMDMGK